MAEMVVLHLFASEKLDQKRTADIQRFVHGRIHFRVVLHRFAPQIAQDPGEMPCRQHKERENGDSQQRKPPIHGQHDRHRGDDPDNICNDADRCIVDRVLGAHHVIIETRHEFACARLGKEAQRHALHMAVKIQAQIKDQPFSDFRI
jgi:hypothetical protein